MSNRVYLQFLILGGVNIITLKAIELDDTDLIKDKDDKYRLTNDAVMAIDLNDVDILFGEVVKARIMKPTCSLEDVLAKCGPLIERFEKLTYRTL